MLRTLKGFYRMPGDLRMRSRIPPSPGGCGWAGTGVRKIGNRILGILLRRRSRPTNHGGAGARTCPAPSAARLFARHTNPTAHLSF